jgi:hypothetical protein
MRAIAAGFEPFPKLDGREIFTGAKISYRVAL